MTQKATFALGCFWGPDDFFSKLNGVTQTTVGYSGGAKENPTYENLGDHTETVEIMFDDSKVSYEELLKHFWKLYDPTETHKTQYKSIIFYHDDMQKKAALLSKEAEEKKLGKKIVTEIRPVGAFYKAEEYHQKYLQKNKGVC